MSVGWSRPWRAADRSGADRGAAVVEFVLVASLLMLVFLGVVQVALVLHARDVLVADAEEGARYAANLGVSAAAGEARCEQFVAASLSRSLLLPGGCVASLQRGPAGLLEVRMDVAARVPLTVLPLGVVHLHATGHALAESGP